MTPSQIKFYESLPEEDKWVLKVAALKAQDISSQTMLALMKAPQKEKPHIQSCLDAARKHGLLHISLGWNSSYTIAIEFMLYVYPTLGTMDKIWKQLHDSRQGAFYNYSLTGMTAFRNYLYTVLHQRGENPIHAAVFTQNLVAFPTDYFVLLIQDPKYDEVISFMEAVLIESALQLILAVNFQQLKPFSEAVPLIARIRSLRNGAVLNADRLNRVQTHLYAGNLPSAVEELPKGDGQEFNLRAIEETTKGNPERALALFEQGLKIQRRTEKTVPVPVVINTAFYYFVALQNVDPKISMPIFQKIDKWLDKKTYFSLHLNRMYKALTAQALGDKNSDSTLNIVRHHYLKDEDNKFSVILWYLFCYMVGIKKMDGAAVGTGVELAEKAYNAGFVAPAYELLFALQTWSDNEKITPLFNKISQQLPYPPVLSRIVHQEEWEKSLNLLLGLQSVSSKTAASAESARVVYFFNPRNYNLQPVLQARQANGWSEGRNVAMKTFWDGNVKGMTDQDRRIAKNIYKDGDYYYQTYEFKKDVFLLLVGHPLVFLEGGKNIPVEFVEAQPIVSIVQSPKGYTLSTDIDAVDDIVLAKETNTRYKVYKITPQQGKILSIILAQKIVVPESGKEKLTTLLGSFTAQGLSIHSDLPALNENTQTATEEVPADSRIRVQLLPLGNGLKAELFSKPFGAHPPYCKPGKGGKVLIAGENDKQLQVKRNFEEETENERTLMNDIQSLDSLSITDGLIAFDEPLDSLHLLDILALHQERCVVEWPEGERYKIRGTAGFDNLHLKVTSGISWFDLQGELKVNENTVLTIQQLLALTAKSHDRFVELKPGEFLALSAELKKQLDELRSFSTVEKKEVRLNKFASVALNDFFENVEDLKVDKSWKEFQRRVTQTKASEIAVPATLQAELRPYQEDGFRWMAHLAEWEGGACLADDMGLGKTVQSLAILLHRAKQGAALVVCPVSVVGNWMNEAARFAPTLRLKTLNVADRAEVLQNLEAGDLLITSYGLLQSEEQLFSEPVFATVILDEAHTIKNYATKTSKATMQLKASFRVALTGTPLQNYMSEIWNLFNFINPGLLGTLQHFTDVFIKPEAEQSHKQLKKLIAPFILRRTKTAVLEELPPKTEIVKKVQLSEEEMAFYEALRRQALENLTNSDAKSGAQHLQVLAEIMKLRQASCHPALVNPDINIASSKLATFTGIVSELIDNKHRALVFSQFVSHLAIVRKELDKRGIRYQYLDGSTPLKAREKSVAAFQRGEGDLFLISLKAGGLGLNLTAADYVIHLDPWWNPAVEDQASDRAHRIGQTRPVTIYRLVAEHTIEEKIIQLHNTKRNLAESLLEGSDKSARLSMNELVSLIKDNG